MVVILIESNYDKIFIKYFGIIFFDKHKYVLSSISVSLFML